MRDTVMLTGATGVLGTWLRRTAPADTRFVSVTHRTRLPDSSAVTADLRDRNAVLAAVQQVQPSLIVHAAYAKDEASIVGATRNVVDAAMSVGAAVVHISSDSVFSGDGAPRDEGADPDPISDYGRWKADAERVVADSTLPAAVVRLSLLVSLDPEDHIIQRMRAGVAAAEPTVWFDDEFRQPAMAADVAAALWRIAALHDADRAGVWHLPGPELLSRYEIARRVVARLALDPACIGREHSPPSNDRPQHIVLRDDRARGAVNWSPAPVLS
ncbi:MAG: sugar nucleotide-binding protein [Ilumatobacteraceae bacterium]